MTTSETYRERFIAEYRQIEAGAARLEAVLSADESGTLPFELKSPRSLLRAQLWTMRDLLKLLTARARIEGIDLEAKE